MKKFLLFIFAIFCICSLRVSAESVYPDIPRWCELCPKVYLDVQENGSYYLPDKQYWAERKKSFEHSKHFCINNYQYDLNKMENCFSALKSSELRKTEEFQKVQKYKSENFVYP